MLIMRMRMTGGGLGTAMDKLLLLTAGAGIFGVMSWASRFHFTPFVVNARMMWIVVPSLVSFAVFLLALPSQSLGVLRSVLVTALFGSSACLLGAALKATRCDPPRLAFQGAPRTLVVSGPYRYVRHPFYLAYLLFWSGCALATSHALSLLMLLLLAVVYAIAAAAEERDFALSPMATAYEAYSARTGFLIPAVPTGLTTPFPRRRR